MFGERSLRQTRPFPCLTHKNLPGRGNATDPSLRLPLRRAASALSMPKLFPVANT